MFVSKSDRSLLALLEREDEALYREETAGEDIVYWRSQMCKIELSTEKTWIDEYKETIRDHYESKIEKAIAQRDKALADLKEIRSQIKEYLLQNIM